jgi:alkylhydroperoxidase/carboxymuconolactone decarboxylase family protein YurZ
LEQGKETYNKATEDAKNELQEDLTNAILTNVSGENVRKNAPAIANIIADVVENNIMEIAGKTGEEYEKGLDKIYSIIHDRMRAIGLSEKEITAAWMTEGLFYHANILPKYIDKVKEAKEAQDTYNETTNKAYEAEKKAAEANTTLKEKVDATARSLMKSANDTDALHSAINQIIKDYSGLNIIDFLVRVNAQVPKWMMDKSVSELSQLAVKFAALAKNAKGDITIGKTKYTKEQLATRAALYAQAAQQKQANIESEKTTTITQKASDALKEYKQALDGVKVAQNLVKQGQKDASFVTKKQTEAQNAYTKALKAGVSEQELLEAKNGKTKGGGSKKDGLGEAVQKNIQYVNEIRKKYEDYRKESLNTNEALEEATKHYSKSLARVNQELSKYGIQGLTGKQLATMNLQQVRDYFQGMLNGAQGSAKAVEALEKALMGVDGEITKFRQKAIVDGLNSELSKLKDEYELAVELDADPEMGSAFAQLFDIDPNQLPKNLEDYAKRATEILNRYFKDDKIELPTINLTDDDLKAYKAILGESKYKILESFTKDYKSRSKKEAQDIVKQTKDLQYKLGDVNEKIAIESKKLADLQVKYQKETNDEKKRLLDLQIKDQENAIKELQSQALVLMPEYKKVFGNIAEYSANVARKLQNDLRSVYDNAKYDPKTGQYELVGSDGKSVFLDKEHYTKEYNKLNKESQKTKSNFQKIKEAFKPSDKDGVVDYAKGIELIGEEAKKAADGLHTIADIVGALGGSADAVEVLNDVATSMEGVATAGQGITQISSGDYIGGAVNVIKGTWQAISTWLDNGDKKISRQIAESERHVKALETSYQDLQDAMEDAYGYGEVAAKRATITNKELQLVELQRQLQLEKSRKKKNQDANRIMELQSAIINLRNELDGSTKDIVNDLLGISSVGDAAEQLVSSMIDAFKNGEDYMKVYEDSFEDMIDNLIMKAIVGEIVGRKVQQMFDAVEKESTKRADKTAYTAKMPSTRDMLEELYPDYGITEKNIRDYNDIYFNRIREAKNFEEVLSAYEKSQAVALQRGEQNFYDMLQKQKELVLSEYADAATIRPEDLRVLTPEWKESWMDGVQDLFTGTMDTLGITFGEGAEKSLSNLQQGIRGVTEETAGAIESYLNGMSQQCYLQSDLLTQIRDAVVAIDSDVQIATNAQILLQLQQSYAVQMAIQSILMGWSTPSGMAVRVELNS